MQGKLSWTYICKWDDAVNRFHWASQYFHDAEKGSQVALLQSPNGIFLSNQIKFIFQLQVFIKFIFQLAYYIIWTNCRKIMGAKESVKILPVQIS